MDRKRAKKTDKPFNMIDNHNSDEIERMLIVPRYTEA